VHLHALLIPSLDNNASDSETASSWPTVPEKIHLRLVNKTEPFRNMCLFRFSLPSSDQVLGLPNDKPIFVCANPTTSNLLMAALASPVSFSTSAPSQDAALDFQFGFP
jgi:hypothetical protein